MAKPRTRSTKIGALTRQTSIDRDYNIASSNRYAPVTYTNYPSVLSGTSDKPGYEKTINDWVTPNFHKLVAMGKIVNNPLYMLHEYEDYPLIDFEATLETWNHMYLNYSQPTQVLYTSDTYSGTEDFNTCFGSANVSYLPYPSKKIDIEKQTALALTSAWASINDSDILIGAAIAESGKTTRDLLTLARKALKVVKAIRRPRMPKRVNKKSLKSAALEAEELYMQARYNLRPVYYDILGVMKLTTQKRYSNRYTHRGWSLDVASDSSSEIRSWPRISRVLLKIDKQTAYTVEARAGVLCNVQDETLWRRMGVSMIVDTAWELVPFSFIADWFGNFGSLISSWAPAPGVKPLTSWITITQEWSSSVSVSIDSFNNMYSDTFRLGSPSKIEASASGLVGQKRRSKTIVQRIPNPRRPFTPEFSVNLDIPKILDLAIIGKNLSRSCKALF